MLEDKKLNEIIRVKRVAGTFATMNKGFLEDDRLSMKAKGILAYLLSKPDNWKVIVGDIIKHCKDSKSAIYSGLKELKENGYYKKEPIRSEDGSRIVRWESTVYEVPMELSADKEPKQEKTASLEQAVTKIKETLRKKKQTFKKETEEEKTEQELSISLFPDFQEIENQFTEKKEHNNNYTTKNYNTKELNSSLSQTETNTTELDKTSIEKMTKFFKEKINYADLVETTYKTEIGLADEFVNVALDCLLSNSDTVRINNENKPRELVKSRLMKLTYEHFIYVLDRFTKQKHRIKKKRQYILTMLYNATMELETHYRNAIATDFGL